ncbi:hypothetical protein DICVIV_07479 [Dictyocaulus viviparus]|uniref:Mediator of RNA polymerase II transcription subunit 13 n=1 Tax=Dictyocaulus viviparus TaxID=29172 RepID=A0A0D8XRR8_DICVI|nr:hypothetical protein DICVIV_07479 [Dictyocaulus viviparus]
MAISGGSLEDCYSNVYALTELNGLKWRCFLTPSNSPRGIPVQSDPILKAYGKCLRDGLLCTWRRKPLQMSSQPEPLPLPSFTNEIAKELWLFWYSTDPPEKLHVESGRRIQVVVGPWSLRAVLLPADTEVGRHQASAEKQWEEWREFVASLASDVDYNEEENREEGVPRMVPVEIDGIRMLYPSCYVCVTMEDDAACFKEETIAPPMTPDELIVNENGRRNQLLVSNVNGHSYMQGVLQNAFLAPSRPPPSPVPPTQVGPFQAPFPPQSEDDTRWNFVDPSKNDSCTCDICTRQPSAEYLAAIEREPVVESPLAAPIKVPSRPGLFKTNPVYTIMKRQSRKRIKHSYHRRYPVKSDCSTVTASSSDSVGSEQDSSDDDSMGAPSWADTNKQSLMTGIYCSADDASTSRVPPTASQEERQRDYNCYYNPTIREDPYYMSYHSRRLGEKRRSSYPPSIKIPISPEQPGSQETIPATTSPMPEIDDHRRRVPETDPSITMTRTTTEIDLKKPDIQVPSCDKLKKSKCQIEWPDLDSLDMAMLSATIGEEMEERISPYVGRISPTYNAEFECDIEERFSSPERDETRAIGCMSCEGPSGLNHSPGSNQQSVFGACIESMEVDETCVGGTTDNINLLSPPASNERPEGYAVVSLNYGGWPRIGGPPSCGDPSMNHIYPTPPSVQSEAQQFSPAPMLPPQQYAVQHQHTNISLIQQHATNIDNGVYTASTNQHNLVNQQSAPATILTKSGRKGAKEDSVDDFDSNKDNITDLVPLESKMARLMKRVQLLPVSGHVRKKIVPSSLRFSPAVDIHALCASLSNRRTPLHMPPDYQKLIRLIEKRVPKTVDALFCAQFSNSVTSVAPAHMTSGTVTSFSSANNYKPTFGPIMAGIPPNPHMQIPPIHHSQSHHAQQFPASQIRTPPMMGGRIVAPVATGSGSMGTPYAPPSGPYGPMMAPPNSVQQLNNFVHGSMFNPSNAQMNPHHQIGSMSMAPPMGQSMYPGGPGQIPMISPCTAGGYGGPPMIGGYGPHGPNIIGPAHTNAPPAYPGTHAPPAYVSMTQLHQLQPPHMRQLHVMQQYVIQDDAFTVDNAHDELLRTPFLIFTLIPFLMLVQYVLVILLYERGKLIMCSYICHIFLLSYLSHSFMDLTYRIVTHLVELVPETLLETAVKPCPCSESAFVHECSRLFSTASGIFLELGLYITPPDVLRMPAHLQQAQIGSWSGFALEQANTCTCGFSAVRHRYLSLCSGLFPEDSREATAIEHSVAPVNGLGAEVGLQASNQIWFDSTSSTDVNMLDLLRIMCQQHNMGHMVNQIAHFVEQADKAIKVANEVRDPREAEWKGLLSEIGPILERALRTVRCMHGVPGNIVEGPLSWRALTNKSLPKSSSPVYDDDIGSPEPIPYINVAAEKDAIRVAPHVVRHWEHLSLGPIDQPKDILYLLVVPDNNEIYSMAVKYIEQLSQMYERMRLGRHIPWPTGCEGRDGCVRVGCRTQNGKYSAETTTLDFLNLVGRYVDNKSFMTKLRLFTQQMEENVLQLVTERDDLFDRAAFREALALDWRAKRAAAAAVALVVEQRMAESI